MNEIKISVIMPCLNAKDYIGEAIKSILNQTLKEWELIVVDAGSDDGTEKIIEKYQAEDSRIVFLRSDRKSMGRQYNMGIQKAKGKYVGFVESDDYIHSDMYHVMFETAENYRLDFVKSDFEMFIRDGGESVFLNYSISPSAKTDIYETVLDPEEHPEILYRDVNMWNGLYRREFLLNNELLLDETAGAAFQDMGFVMKSFLLAQRIMYLRIPSYYYRKDNVNASVYKYSRHVQFVMDEFFFVWDFIRQRDISAPFRAVVLNRFLGMFCASYDHFLLYGTGHMQSKENICHFMKCFRNCCQRLDYSEFRDEMLDLSPFLDLMDSFSDFESARKYIADFDRKVKTAFYQKVKDRELIIFGSGEYGTALYAFLRKNHVKTVLCFCDNDMAKTEEQVMGIDCILPSQVAEYFPKKIQDVLFLVANENHYQEMNRQLRHMGIERKNIIRSIKIFPHNAFEMDIVSGANRK